MDMCRPVHRVAVKPRRRWAAIAAVALAAVVAPLAVGPTAAHADLASANATYRITTQASLAFDVAGASTDWGPRSSSGMSTAGTTSNGSWCR
jgi:hypothetical protein